MSSIPYPLSPISIPDYDMHNVYKLLIIILSVYVLFTSKLHIENSLHKAMFESGDNDYHSLLVKLKTSFQNNH